MTIRSIGDFYGNSHQEADSRNPQADDHRGDSQAAERSSRAGSRGSGRRRSRGDQGRRLRRAQQPHRLHQGSQDPGAQARQAAQGRA